MRKQILGLLRAIVFVVFILFRFLIFIGGIYIAFFGFSIAVIVILIKKNYHYIKPLKK